MITGRRTAFDARCRQRGYTRDDVRPCIVSEDGDKITVDETHPSYPRPKSGPSLLQKVANFSVSAAKHVASGMRLAPEEEVARRFAICQACEHYDGNACKRCGCPVKRERQFISKLAWAGESCPAGKWGPADTGK